MQPAPRLPCSQGLHKVDPREGFGCSTVALHNLARGCCKGLGAGGPFTDGLERPRDRRTLVQGQHLKLNISMIEQLFGIDLDGTSGKTLTAYLRTGSLVVFELNWGGFGPPPNPLLPSRKKTA